MPKPNPGESESDYMPRCMGNSEMQSKYPDESQRAAVCHSIFRTEKAQPAIDTTPSKAAIVTRPCASPQLEAKVDAEHGEISGYAAVFDNVDFQGDIIRRGAFKKSCNERVKAGKVLLMIRHFAHGGDTAEAIGLIEEAREDTKGLWIRAKLYGSQLAQETREKIMASPKAYGMSVGYSALKASDLYDEEGNKTGAELLECKLYEVTVTAVPANEETTASAKSGAVPAKSLAELEGEMRALAARMDAIAPRKQPESTATAQDDSAAKVAAIRSFEAARSRRKRAIARIGGR